MLKLTLQVLSFILSAYILIITALFLAAFYNPWGMIFTGLSVVFLTLLAIYEPSHEKPFYYQLIKKR